MRRKYLKARYAFTQVFGEGLTVKAHLGRQLKPEKDWDVRG